ncbi:MAG TPA: NAD(P)/FAD-dependent oxidoreductase [Acidimicrobiales bacterium]
MTAGWDAIVVGAGPNGLVAANVLADAGWRVVVLEAQPEPGGAVRTAEVTAPGFRNDLFSAFYPLAADPAPISRLGLERHGLRWAHAPAVVAHPVADGPAALLHRSPEATAAALDRDAPGDGSAWLELAERWDRQGRAVLRALLGPFPPVRAGVAALARIGRRDLLPLARFLALPVRRLAEEQFRGRSAGLLLAGNALHADVPPDAAPSGFLGWMLASLAQDVGFPAPVGGAGELAAALVRRLRHAGGQVVCDARVDRVVVEDGRATGVEVAGSPVMARHAVLADVDAEVLYRRLVGAEHLPPATVAALDRFERGWATVKVDWALRAPIPWRDPEVAKAGTVHLAESIDELAVTAATIGGGRLPDDPFVVLGQMTTTDPTRSPAGTESAWAYTHVPPVVSGDGGPRPLAEPDVDGVVRRVEDRIEGHAPGFRDLILARHVLAPSDLERHDANLVAGDMAGGTNQLHQQLVFRPIPGLARPETPVRGLYLASSSAHPGGGVHGACGTNAARAARARRRLDQIRLFGGWSSRQSGRPARP